MAKQQSFADKSKSKSKSEFTSFKCIVSQYDAESGGWKFREKMVKVKDPKDIETMKF
ncbi:MAG: hypothetical protein HY962_14745 [Ignavibacteriae bacterium]|nr:hypothetical protein [Ignavibacteriota bacterium]